MQITRGSRTVPLATSGAAGLSLNEKAMAKREAAITRSVRGAVFVHLLLGTIPFVCFGTALAALGYGVCPRVSMHD